MRVGRGRATRDRDIADTMSLYARFRTRKKFVCTYTHTYVYTRRIIVVVRACGVPIPGTGAGHVRGGFNDGNK